MIYGGRFRLIMNKASEARLQKVHPRLAFAIRELEAILLSLSVPIQIEVVQGLRTFAEQDRLFQQGRSRPGQIVTRARGGQSEHNYGTAVDVCPFVNGKPDWNANLEVWTWIGNKAAGLGLEWGGNWKKFIDKPHIQLNSPSIKEMFRLYGKGNGLKLVWDAVDKLNK